MNCVNRNLPEFKMLQGLSGANEFILAAKISVWQDQNGLESFPTIEDLGLARQPINEVDKVTDSTKVKEGVVELFESNPELANSVYEAMGVDDKEITIGKGSLDNDNYEGDIYPIRINNEYAGYFTITKRHGTNKLPIEKQGFISGSVSSYGIELENKFQGQGYGKRVYLQIAKELAKEGITLKSEFFGKSDIGDKANSVWAKLVDEGYAIDKGEYFEVVNLYAPQQKQQAQQAYSNYLDTIFSDSTVKDIVYHADDRGGLTNETLVDDLTHVYIQGVYFTSELEYAKNLKRKQVYKALVNSKAPLKTDKNTIERLGRKPEELPSANDSAIHYSNNEKADRYGKIGTEIVVFEPEQIHILGGKQDIEGFKEFVSKLGSTTVQNKSLLSGNVDTQNDFISGKDLSLDNKLDWRTEDNDSEDPFMC